MGEGLREKIHDANIEVHRYEAKYYELLHPEVYGRQEQEGSNSAVALSNDARAPIAL